MNTTDKLINKLEKEYEKFIAEIKDKGVLKNAPLLNPP